MKRNTIILFISEGLGSVLSALVALIAARALNVAEFGQFAATLALAQLASIAIDSGMGVVIAREIAGGKERMQRWVNEIFTWRLVALGVGLLATPFLVMSLSGTSLQSVWYVLIPGVFFLGFVDFWGWVFKGADRIAFCAIFQVASRAILLGTVLLGLYGASPLLGLAWAHLAVGALVGVGGYLTVRLGVLPLKVAPLREEFFRKRFSLIYQTGILLILNVAFSRIDTILVSHFLGDWDAGVYGAAARLIDGVRILPLVIYSIALPAFSRLQTRPHELGQMFRQMMGGVVIAGIVTVIGGFMAARPIVLWFFGEAYSMALAPLYPMLLSCVFVFANILLFAVLYALQNHRALVHSILGAIIVQVAFNAFLLPSVGVVGAGWARLLAELVNFVLLAWAAGRHGLWTCRSL